MSTDTAAENPGRKMERHPVFTPPGRRALQLAWSIVRPMLGHTAGRLITRAWSSRNRFLRTMLFDAARDTRGMNLVLRHQGREQYVLNARDDMICRSVFTYGEHDFAKLERALSILGDRRGLKQLDLLIDVGANIGTICIPAVNRGHAARALAIEPHPVNCRLLRANAALNGLSHRIVVHECAAGAVPDEMLQIVLEGDNWGDVRVSPGGQRSSFAPDRQTFSVPSKRVDDVVGVYDPSRTLLWIDTQGFEASVLRGAPTLLGQGIPLVIEFDPGMLAAQSGGLSALIEQVRGYSTFFDLEDPEQPRPCASLESLCLEMSAARRQFTDLLFL